MIQADENHSLFVSNRLHRRTFCGTCTVSAPKMPLRSAEFDGPGGWECAAGKLWCMKFSADGLSFRPDDPYRALLKTAGAGRPRHSSS